MVQPQGLRMTDISVYRATRYRLAREYADRVDELMKTIERAPDDELLLHGLAINAAWEKFCKVDQVYCAARKRERAASEEG